MRCLLFLIVLLQLTSTAISQEQKENFITIDKFPPKARTYSIELTFYDNEVNTYSRSKKYIESIFPQLSYLDLVTKDADIVVKIFADKPMELMEARRTERYAELVKKYEQIQPIPIITNPNQIGYFLPIVISVEQKDSSMYTLEAAGQYFVRDVIAKTSTPNVPIGIVPANSMLRTTYPGRETERTNVLENLNFIRIHLKDITR